MTPLQPRYRYARTLAHLVHQRVGNKPPVDVLGAAASFGIAVRDRPLGPRRRGQIGRRGGHVELVLNSEWKWGSEGERRWVIAEELGHAMLEHPALVESVLGGHEWQREGQRDSMEREARAFAEELLMPAHQVRAYFRFSSYERGLDNVPLRERSIDETIIALAELFQVTRTAMGYRIEGLRLARPWIERVTDIDIREGRHG